MDQKVKLKESEKRDKYQDLAWESKKLLNMKVTIIRGAYDKFTDFFRMGTFIDRTRKKLYSPALVVPFQKLPEGPMEVFLCERVNDLRHSLFLSSIVSRQQPLSLGNNQKSQGAN